MRHSAGSVFETDDTTVQGSMELNDPCACLMSNTKIASWSVISSERTKCPPACPEFLWRLEVAMEGTCSSVSSFLAPMKPNCLQHCCAPRQAVTNTVFSGFHVCGTTRTDITGPIVEFGSMRFVDCASSTYIFRVCKLSARCA